MAMKEHEFIRPGIIKGVYPEKEYEEQGSVESFINTNLNRIKNHKVVLKKKYRFIVDSVNRAEAKFIGMGEHELSNFIASLRRKLQQFGLRDDLVIEAFAVIKEISGRRLGMRHFDVQLIGGWIMLKGMIAEMDTGEGKTLTATLPACTVALTGVPVHIVTVNDYLVRRDMEQMSPIYQALGLSVGAITEQMDSAERQHAYGCDITYCTNKQLAFDYLRDRLVFGKKMSKSQLQLEKIAKKDSLFNRLHLRGLCYAIIDEADSVLIDEARTPLILSKEGKGVGMEQIVVQAIETSEKLEPNKHFLIDLQNRTIEINESGKRYLRELTGSFGGVWSGYQRSVELISQALSAMYLFERDKHYLVKDEKIQIIDEYTGRLMADRSWEYGLHQMLEAKEGCHITAQKETLAKISYQQFFSKYLKLAGMTGTAREVRNELWSVYRLNVARIPTNRPVRRKRYDTLIFSTIDQKWDGVLKQVDSIHEQGRPILIGTRSVEASEHLSALLTKHGFQHEVLNARQDAQEADIIKKAGQYGQITVATNMAGRGTDIKLSEEIIDNGGLHVIATECHEARRIDRQLYGRCGRQGDPGSYALLLSLEDEIVSKFCPNLWISVVRGGKSYNTPIVKKIIESYIFENAQKIAERKYAGQRKNLLSLDIRLKSLLAFSGLSD